MPVCANCGTEYEEGQKFCFECGAPIPQTKKCIKCGAEIALKMKFCPECGAKQDGTAKAGVAGLSMGDKNVIAGDVIGHKEETHVAGNATIIKNEDETKKVKKCHVCGSIVLITDGFVCPECGEFTCNDCYDETFGICTTCAKNRSKNAEKQYKEALVKVLEDGRVELSERRELEALKKKLGISSERAQELEEEMRNSAVDSDALTIFEERSYKEAFNAFYDECDEVKALEILEPIYNKHPLNEKVLSLYLPVLAENNAYEAMEIIDNLKVDFLISTVTAADIAIRCKDFDRAERILKSSMNTWSDKPLFNCCRALFYFAMYKHFSDKSFLKKANEITETLSESDDELSLSYITKIQIMLAEEAGDTSLAAEFTKKFCKENSLYWRIIKSDLLSEINMSSDDEDDSFFFDNEDDDSDDSEGMFRIEDGVLTKCSADAVNAEIPDGITEIGQYAFTDCSNLETVVIPSSVTRVGDCAFYECSNLERIIYKGTRDEWNEVSKGYGWKESTNIEDVECSDDEDDYDNVEDAEYLTIEDGVVTGCSKDAVNVVIPYGVTKIGEDAFNSCKLLEFIEIPDSVTEIGECAFLGCESLKSIEIPDSVIDIGNRAFSNCKLFESIRIPNNITIAKRAFYFCESLKSIEIPDNITEIGEEAFCCCYSLESIEIPDSVTKIGEDAFAGCKSLKSIKIPDSVTEIGKWAFDNCSSLESIEIPSDCKIEDNSFDEHTKVIRR